MAPADLSREEVLDLVRRLPVVDEVEFAAVKRSYDLKTRMAGLLAHLPFGGHDETLTVFDPATGSEPPADSVTLVRKVSPLEHQDP